MRKFFIILFVLAVALFTFSTNSFAEEYDDRHWSEVCSDWAEYYEVIMEGRQAGASIQFMLDFAEGNKHFKEVVLDADDYPRAESEREYNRIMEEFVNKWHAYCIRAIR